MGQQWTTPGASSLGADLLNAKIVSYNRNVIGTLLDMASMEPDYACTCFGVSKAYLSHILGMTEAALVEASSVALPLWRPMIASGRGGYGDMFRIILDEAETPAARIKRRAFVRPFSDPIYVLAESYFYMFREIAHASFGHAAIAARISQAEMSRFASLDIYEARQTFYNKVPRLVPLSPDPLGIKSDQLSTLVRQVASSV